MKFDVFCDSNSIIHKLDPRFKMLSALGLSILIAFINNIESIFIGLLFGIISIFTAKLNLKNVITRLLISNIITAILWIVLPFSTPGNILIHIYRLPITYEGILKAFTITLKCNTILLILISYMATIPIVEQGHALQKLKFNKKLTQLLFFFYRYLDVIYTELERFQNLLKIRGFTPKTNIHTYNTYSNLVGMLLVKSVERADRIHMAMLCRGFNGNYYTIKSLKTQKNDLLFLTICISIALTIIFLSVIS